MLLWHQYPRLGIDERSQWEFFADFPDGKEGLRTAVQEAHRGGVKVFLPYKPWDAAPQESSITSARQATEVIQESDADGFFLDTMNNMPANFRESIDAAKSGIVFCSECRPANKQSLEKITSSWNQYDRKETAITNDLLRFTVPSHFSPVISRWSVGDKKDFMIKKAILNGTGIVIWQDIFGTWLPYSKEQKQKIRQYKQVWMENRSIFQCQNPIPFFPTLQRDLVCNQF